MRKLNLAKRDCFHHTGDCREPVCITIARLHRISAHSVHGNVTDSSGKAVSGASVLNLKSGKGTSTDQDGNFSIRAVNGQALQISFVGFQRVRVAYSGQANIAVKLLGR